MKNYIKCETSNIDEKVKYLYEYFNGIKETEKLNEVLLKNSIFWQNKLIRRDELIKSVSQTSVEE